MNSKIVVKPINAARVCLVLILTATAASGNARNLPHAELVKKHLQGGHYKAVLSGCKGLRMTAPPASAGHELECWAAVTANELENQPQAINRMVLNDVAREAALSSCRPLRIEERFKSKDCEAAIRADTFISLRLPRAASTLKPVKFN